MYIHADCEHNIIHAHLMKCECIGLYVATYVYVSEILAYHMYIPSIYISA